MRKIISLVLLLTCSLTYAYRDTETGTFLTRDPIGYEDGPNVYCYVHCNPITKFDPLGLSVSANKNEIQTFVQEMQKLTEHQLVVKKHWFRDPTVEISQSADSQKSKTPHGDDLVRRVIDTKSEISLKLTKGDSSQKGTSKGGIKFVLPGQKLPKTTFDSVVKFNPNQQGKVTTKDLATGKVSDKATSPQVILAHELIHAERDARGDQLSSSATEKHTYVDQNGTTKTERVSKEEMATVGLGHNTVNDITENQIRSEQSSDERVSYEP